MAINRKKLNVILWVIQIVLALLYLFTGGAKLTLPIAVMTMIGATTIMLVTRGVAQALMPLYVGLLVAFVASGRWRLAPIASRESSGTPVPQATN
jgi:hypothetical protein